MHENHWVGLMLFSWIISDIFRYPFYLLNTWKISPFWLNFLRYSNFFYQYPLNLISETNVFILMVPFIHKRKIFYLTLNMILPIDYQVSIENNIILFNYLYFEILLKSYGILKFWNNYQYLKILFDVKILNKEYPKQKIE